MRLKSFEARGFKSFADKVGLDFENGITAIVGPNGSGKSNISDAIRWVMGEQSAKYLRGTKMEDVIFAGSSVRRAMGLAEVTLVFDNTDHALPVDFDEVTITRRVFRSGDSEYYINKKACRLKDVVTLLADTGLGRGSMSIIGQNKIDEILNARPEDRRTIFEEAAGIAKYRMRKKEAMRKLEDTGTNLVRISDIKSEIESRLAPLKEASEKAVIYQGKADELKKVEVTQFVHKIENIEAIKNKLADKYTALEEQNNNLLTDVNVKEAESVSLKVELDKLNEQYNQLQTILAEKEKHIETIRGQEGVMEERIAQSHNNIERLKKSKEKLTEQLTAMNANLENIAKQYDSLDTERSKAQIATDQCGEEQEAITAKIKELEEKISSFQSTVFEGMQEIVNMRNRITSLQQEQDQLHKKNEQLKISIAEGESKYQETENKNREFVDESERVAEQRTQDKEQMTKATGERTALGQALNEQYRGRELLNREIEKTEARLNVLENMEREHEGFGRGVKAVIKNQSTWQQGVVGVVAELFKVEGPYVTAIETALGGAMQNIITADASVAKAAINFLKASKSGRATFLPLDTIRPRSLADRDKSALGEPGILGIAADYVKTEEQVRPAVNFLLGQVLVARDMDAALNAARKSDMRLRIVTLDGEIIYAGGSMSGGQKQTGATSFLSRKQEITSLEAALADKHKSLLALQETLEVKEDRIKELNQKIAEYQTALQKYEVRQAELTAFLERTKAEKAAHRENITLLSGEKEANSKRFMEANGEINELKPKLAAMESEDAQGKAEADKLSKELAGAKLAQETITSRYQAAKIALETAKNSTTVVGERMQQVDAEVSRLQQEININEEEAVKTNELITTTSKAKEELHAQQQTLLQELKNTDSGKEVFLGKRQVIIDKQAAAQEALDEAKKQQIICQQKLHTVEMDKVKQVTEYDNALEQMGNTHKLTPGEAREAGLVLEMSDTALHKESASLHKEIEALGPVNIGAIEEYKTTSERFTFLDKQYKDLCEAKAKLETVISGINTDMSKRFKEAFAKINDYFASCYTKLFGGGKAKLVMLDESDILESGVDIVVQPPGKKLQNLALLSGGERALTVIALLFALLTYQPAPFCILDEIDAPLDEANIDRFAKFLSDYAKDTQFIVITHRKGTMEAANVLHGVTMEESGISRLLSVKLSEIE